VKTACEQSQFLDPQNTALITVKYRIHLIYLGVTPFNNGVSLLSVFSMAARLRQTISRNWLKFKLRKEKRYEAKGIILGLSIGVRVSGH